MFISTIVCTLYRVTMQYIVCTLTCTQYLVQLYIKDHCNCTVCTVHQPGCRPVSREQVSAQTQWRRSTWAVCSRWIVNYSAVQYSTVKYSRVMYSPVQNGNVQYNTVQCSPAHYNVWQVKWLVCRQGWAKPLPDRQSWGQGCLWPLLLLLSTRCSGKWVVASV